MARGIGYILPGDGPAAVMQNVLIVEDREDTCKYLKTLLEANGFGVRIAADGGQAHAYFAMYEPDIVILDLILPGESGFEICERMKALKEDVPVMMLSVIDLESSRNLAKKAGADGYLTKPIRPQQLLEQIHEIGQKAFRHAQRDKSQDIGAIRFTCRCGKRYKVSIRRQGKLMTCTKCGEVMTVPRQG